MSEPKKPPVAIALQYQPSQAPRVVAKGRGAVAESIIATARANGVAIEANPILAEALSAVDLDEEIPEQLYRAVAEVIAFVLRASGRVA